VKTSLPNVVTAREALRGLRRDPEPTEEVKTANMGNSCSEIPPVATILHFNAHKGIRSRSSRPIARGGVLRSSS